MRSWSVTSTVRAFHRSQNAPLILSKRTVFSGQGSSDGGQDGGYSRFVKSTATVAATAAAAAALLYSNDRLSLKAEVGVEEVVLKENRVRQFSTPDKIFNYFASYLFVGNSGRRAMMMSPLEMYSSFTPDCRLVHGVGAGAHVEVTEAEVNEGKVKMEQSPVKDSLLNEIGQLGLLSYSDYCFLLALISTPRKYIDTTFNIFDVTGDGNIEPKEFAYVSTKMAHKSGGFGSYTDTDQEEVLASSSGLLNYLFGKERNQTLTREKFRKLHRDLLEEIIHLEFMAFDKEGSGRISEADFVRFLLANGKITPKRKATLIKKIEKKWPSKGRGISYPSFKSFFFVLAGSVELERALFFLDVEGIGVDKEEFRKISSWVSQDPTSDHIVNVIYELLDDDEDDRLYREDISAVLLDWRNSRGYDKGGIHVSLGNIRI